MSLDEEFKRMSPELAIEVFKASVDKVIELSEEESSAMTTSMVDEYPAFSAILESLQGLVEEGDFTAEEAMRMGFGCVATLLTLREYAKADELRRDFPDIPDTSIN